MSYHHETQLSHGWQYKVLSHPCRFSTFQNNTSLVRQTLLFHTKCWSCKPTDVTSWGKQTMFILPPSGDLGTSKRGQNLQPYRQNSSRRSIKWHLLPTCTITYCCSWKNHIFLLSRPVNAEQNTVLKYYFPFDKYAYLSESDCKTWWSWNSVNQWEHYLQLAFSYIN